VWVPRMNFTGVLEDMGIERCLESLSAEKFTLMWYG